MERKRPPIEPKKPDFWRDLRGENMARSRMGYPMTNSKDYFEQNKHIYEKPLDKQNKKA